jgi:hypothetical protein
MIASFMGLTPETLAVLEKNDRQTNNSIFPD